jgi:hypothetical protein
MSDDSTAPPGGRTGGAEVVALVPWQRTLHRARKARVAFNPTARPGAGGSAGLPRIDPRALAESDAAIAAAAPLEAYYAVKQIGLADAIPVLSVLSTEQIQTLFDLELWKGDALEIPDLLSWLEGFRIAGHAALVGAARALDEEALATLFRRRLLIAPVPNEDRSDPDVVPEWARNPPPEIEPIVQTPDGRYLVAARTRDARDELHDEDGEVDEEERKQVLGLVRDLYLDEGYDEVARILRMAMDDLGSVLEEDAYRFRSARVEDLGFPPYERAIEVYGPLDPEALDGPAVTHGPLPEARLPLVHAETLTHGLLEAALRGVDARVAERVESDLLAVMNMVLVADRVDPGDIDGVVAALERARAYLELGLAFGVAPGARAEVAAERLRRLHPQVPLRVGYTLTLRLRSRARALLESSALSGLGLDAWSGAARGVLEALLEKRPRFGEALEPRFDTPDAPLDPARADDARPFRTPEDVEAASAWLEEAERLVRAVEGRGLSGPIPSEGVRPEDPAEHDLELRVTTAGANALLGRGFVLRPLEAGDVEALVDELGLHPERPRFERVDAATEAARAELDAPEGEVLGAWVERGLAALAEAWFPLVGQERIDLRFVEGVLRRR